MLVLFAVFVVVAMVPGCAPYFRPMSGARLALVPLEDAPSSQLWLTFVPWSASSPAVLHRLGDNNYRVACFDTAMGLVWKYDVDPEGMNGGIRYTDLLELFMVQGTRSPGLMAYFYGPGDTMYAFVSRLDPAGAALDTVCLYRMPHDRGATTPRRFALMVSPDSLTAVLMIRDHTPTLDSVGVRCMMFDERWNKVGERMVEMAGDKEQERDSFIGITNDRRLVAVWIDGDNTIRGTEYPSSGTGRSFAIPVTDPEHDGATLLWYEHSIENDSELVMLARMQDGRDIHGILSARVDTRSFAVTSSVYTPIDTAMAQRLIDQEYLTDILQAKVVRPKDGVAQRIICLENSRLSGPIGGLDGGFTQVSSAWYRFAGRNVAMLALGSDDKLVWNNAVRKNVVGMVYNPAFAGPFVTVSDITLTGSDRIRCLYLDSARLIRREFRSTDGTEIVERNGALVEMSGNYVVRYSHWLNDSTLYLLVADMAGWFVCRVEVP